MTVQHFHVQRPLRPDTSVVFACPHSGRDYPFDLTSKSRLDAVKIRSSEDAFVDQLVGNASLHGATVLVASAPRAYVDLNRAAGELDPAVIEGARRSGTNPRIASGLGVIPRVVSGGQPIYDGKLTLSEAQRRLDAVWHPYHAALSELMQASYRRFAEAILLDMHSMPPEALDAVDTDQRPEIVLGDRFGASASAAVADRVEAAFTDHGFRVARNAPFAGAFITQHYGRPARGHHCVQIEIDRSLYMEVPGRLEKGTRFEEFRARLAPVIAQLAAIGRLEARGLAAE